MDGISDTFALAFADEDYYKQALLSLKPAHFSLELEQTENLNAVFYEGRYYKDLYPFLSLRRRFRLYCKLTSFFCRKLLMTKYFKFLSNSMLLLNTLFIMLQLYPYLLQYVFFTFFYVETLLKLVANGVFNKNGYFSSGYNILDFLINFSFLFTSFSNEYNYMDFSPFRSLRILNLIPSPKLQHILQSIISSFLLLSEILIILLSFLLFYALIGLHLFHGLLKNRCLLPETGLPNLFTTIIFCGNVACDSGSICGKVPFNPDSDITSFDDMFHAMLQVFRFFTLSDWTSTMYLLQRTYSNLAWIYPLSLIFLGNYFLLNLMFAVLKVKFSENQKKFIELKGKIVNEVKNKFDFKQMVKERLYQARNSKKISSISKFLFTSMNSNRVHPKESTKTQLRIPLYKNTTLNSLENLKTNHCLEFFWRYVAKIKENMKNFSVQRMSISRVLANIKGNYLEIRVIKEIEYFSNSYNDVILLKKCDEKRRKNSMMPRMDFSHEVKKIQRRCENDKYMFFNNEQKQSISNKTISTKKTVPLRGITQKKITGRNTMKIGLKTTNPEKLFKGRKGFLLIFLWENERGI